MKILVLGGAGFPAMRQQFLDPAIGLGRESGENVFQIGKGIVAIELGRLNQTHDGSGPLSSSQAAGK